jgi:hypothetical protein
VAKLAEEFVCVRIQSMNGININLFQFDGDLTWMAFFMDAHDRFYARYGGREDTGPETLLSKASLLNVMQQVLRLHQTSLQAAANDQLATKSAPRVPEEIPNLKSRMARSKPGTRCIHCHDVKQAELAEQRLAGSFSKEMVFTYPMPSAVGIGLDRDLQQKILTVRPDSAAAKGGVRPGDVVQKVNGRHILTAADFAWVLERTPRQAELPLEVQRDGETIRTTLKLTGTWRTTEDPSWRSSTYLAGPNAGFWAEPLSEARKQKASLAKDALALRVTIFFGGHPAPVKAGLKVNDVIIEFDGKRQPMTVRQLHTYCQMNHEYGDEIPITILREGKEVKLTLEMPDKPARLN